MSTGEPIDVVYTWVDDAFPGYRDELARWSGRPEDASPDRTRDNLGLLRYAMRSLERHAPWVRRVFLLTARPQVPAWLDPEAPGLRVVHHDEVFPPAHLPTFSSLAIAANLHRVPGVGERFLWICDDMLLGRDVDPRMLVTDDGRHVVYPQVDGTPPGSARARDGASGWNLALAHSNHLLDTRYRRERRAMLKHVPLAIHRPSWERMVDTWRDDFERTSSSRFRARGNVAPEHLYPYFLLYEGLAERARLATSYARAGYHGLGNWLPFQRLGLAWLGLHRPPFYCLNDNFPPVPSPRVERFVTRWLEARYPAPSRFERR